MLKFLSIATLTLALASVSKAETPVAAAYYQISKPTVVEEPVDQLTLQQIRNTYKLQDLQRPTHIRDDNPLDPINDANKIVDGIINLGAKIWKIFEASSPVVNLNTQRANALPKQLQDWTEMETWSDVEAKQYSVSYKNGFGSEVVRFKLLLTYAYNGSYKGAGKYLNQVGFLVNEYKVAPLYKLEGESEVVRVQNVGSKLAPVAGMEINMIYRISNVLSKSQTGLNYYLRGDGAVKFRQAD